MLIKKFLQTTMVVGAVSLVAGGLASPAGALTRPSSPDISSPGYLPPPRPPVPNCGDSIAVTSTGYSGGKFHFKLVGTDLGRWLYSGYGTMDYGYGPENGGTDHFGSVNASRYGGARTALLYVTIRKGDNVAISADIAEGDQTKCQSQFFVPAR